MQIFEILIIVAAPVAIVLHRILNEKLNKLYVIGLLVLLLLIHLVLEGTRWQMVPAYMLWLIAVVTAYIQPGQKSSRGIRFVKTAGLMVLLVLSVFFPSLFPVFELPRVTGPYTVGTTDIYLESDREEVITPDDGDKRRLMIKAWYPSTERNGEMDPYIDKGGRNGFARKYKLPFAVFNYLDKIETNVYRDIQVSEEVFPVLIFSHGYNSKANGYYALLKELVSHGYVIFAINHSYESTGTTFPDGSEIYFDYDYAGKVEYGTWEQIEPVLESFRNGQTFEERHPLVSEVLQTYFVKDIVERWAFDIVDVLDELEDWNNTGFFKDRLDVSSVGVFGHSRGGGAAGASLLIDDRIKAGVNLDGVQWGKIADSVFQKPFLFMSADWPADHEDLNSHAYVNKSTSWFYKGLLLQSEHSNFMDIPYMIPLKSLSLAGKIDPDLAVEITSRVTCSFFDRHLKGRDVDLHALDEAYEMLNLEVFKGDSVGSVIEF